MRSVVDEWHADFTRSGRIVHVEEIEAREAIYSELEPPIPSDIAPALREQGIQRLYRHQVQAIERIRAGTHTVVVAGTASGKSLCYQLPIAEAISQGAPATALAIYPTKALTHDQLRSFTSLGTADMVAATYDGDTAYEQRGWIRRHANVVLTNPDMLHVGVLPHHSRWADFLHRLRYVVVDELHVFRGIFGSHVAHVLRRLRRLAHHYGSSPTFVFCSATIGNPGDLARSLVGLPVEVVEQDTSPAGSKVFVLWNPPLDNEAAGNRRSSLAETTEVFVDLVRRHVHTIAFARSRKATELIYRWAHDRLDPEEADRIAPYRGGYLAEDRRRIEMALTNGDLLGVAATNALELGIDIGGLDAAVINTFPGTIASLRQQAGRAGRSQSESLAVLIGGEDALDQYYMTHPDQLFARAPEAAVVNPANPAILEAHMGCAAYELPLLPEDRSYLGEEIEEAAPSLVESDDLRLRGGKLFWARRRPPAPGVNIRSTGGPVYDILESGSGDLLGSVEESRAFSQVHPGAIYLHQGESHLVERFDRDAQEVWVQRKDVGYYTQPKEEKNLEIVRLDDSAPTGHIDSHLGMVEVDSHVVAFRRKEIRSGAVLGTEPLDLPPVRLTTQAFWFTIPEELYAEAGIPWNEVPGTLHAVEHTAIAMLPLFAICDRWDVGGLSIALHFQTRGGVFFIYDGYDGGAGIAPIGYENRRELLEATLEALRRCPCSAGCPSCVHSPKCGNFNDPLEKEGARRLLESALG